MEKYSWNILTLQNLQQKKQLRRGGFYPFGFHRERKKIAGAELGYGRMAEQASTQQTKEKYTI